MKVFFFANINDEITQPDSEWSSIQQERIDKNAVLNFLVGVCPCGADSLYRFEYYRNSPTNKDSEVEEVELTCPGCGTKQILTIRCNKYEGVQTRLLESWSTDVQTEGFTKRDVEQELAMVKDELRQLDCGSIQDIYTQQIKHHPGKELVCKLRLPTYSSTKTRAFFENVAEQYKGQILFHLLNKYKG